MKETLADKLFELEKIYSKIEDIIEDAFEEFEPEISKVLEFDIKTDWYDRSVEIHFNIALPYPYEPCKEIRQKIYELGFSNVYWIFKKDTMDVMCDRVIGQEPNLVKDSYDEVRNWEPRHSKYAIWEVTKYGYVDFRFNEQEWISKYYYKKDENKT